MFGCICIYALNWVYYVECIDLGTFTLIHSIWCIHLDIALTAFSCMQSLGCILWGTFTCKYSTKFIDLVHSFGCMYLGAFTLMLSLGCIQLGIFTWVHSHWCIHLVAFTWVHSIVFIWLYSHCCIKLSTLTNVRIENSYMWDTGHSYTHTYIQTDMSGL